MTDSPEGAWNADTAADEHDLVQAIRTAYLQSELAREYERSALTADVDRQLRAAVEAARDAGVEWGKIAAALGTRRGNAYQRYRRRPHTPEQA